MASDDEDVVPRLAEGLGTAVPLSIRSTCLAITPVTVNHFDVTSFSRHAPPQHGRGLRIWLKMRSGLLVGRRQQR
jgi:hypothetical protein